MYNKGVLSSAGAIIAFLVGSGVASGQEVLQYYTAFGMPGSFLALAVGGILSIIICSIVMGDSASGLIARGEDVLLYYCGKTIGTIIKYEMAIFLFLSYVVMIAGAGSIGAEGFGISNTLSRLIASALCCITVMLGLDRIVSIIGKLGPVIIVVTIILCIVSFLENPFDFKQASEICASLDVRKASDNWLSSGLNYACFSMIGAYPLLASLGKNIDIKYAGKCAYLGIGGFYVTLLFISSVLLGNIENIYSLDIPMIYIVANIVPFLSVVFMVLMMLGLYTTAVSLEWESIKSFCPDEKTFIYKWFAAAASLIGFALSAIPFPTLINTIFPIQGYLGIFVVICTLVKKIKLVISEY